MVKGLDTRTAGTMSQLGAFAVAIIAVLFSWVFVYYLIPFFQIDAKYHLPNLGPSDEQYQLYLKHQNRADSLNGALVFAILGGILGCGWAWLIWPSRIGLVFIGSMIGFLSGAIGGFAGCNLQQKFTTMGLISIGQSCSINALVFGCIGFGIATLIGSLVGLNRKALQSSLAGLLGGAMGGALYPVVASFVVASADTSSFIPIESVARWLWLGVGSLALAFIIPLTTQQNSNRPTTQSQQVASDS